MKRFTYIVLAMIISFSFIFTSCKSSKETKNIYTNSKEYSDFILTKPTLKLNSITKESLYDIAVELNADSRTLQGQEKIKYVNNSSKGLKEVYFHLYPNAYKSQATAPTLFVGVNRMYPNGFNPGYINISNVYSRNNKINFQITGEDETILKVSLGTTLKSGDSIDLIIDFNVLIPEASDRFGVIDHCYNLGNWYPIAAVLDETGWNLDPYYKIGDPFYSNVSTYNVKITVPPSFTVAATGEPEPERFENNKRVFSFKETSVRDFAWVASNNFTIRKSNVDGININCYFLTNNEESNTTAMKAAEDSIKIFDSVYGKYPYKNYSVVETNFGTGMEYPQLVYIGQQYYTSKDMLSALEVCIVHETAHQWWYGAVGDDEVDEAWLDESFASYSEGIYYEKKDSSNMFFYNIQNSYENSKIALKGNELILRPVNKFVSWNDYGPLVYKKGAAMLIELRKEVGDDLFFKIMETYYGQFKLKNAKTIDFINVVEEVTDKKWDTFFRKWLLNK